MGKTKRLVFAVIILILIISTGLSMTGFFAADKHDGRCEGCNIVVFTLDALRSDHLSSYGYFRETSPVIDSIAGEGVTFTNAFSQIPHTPPSHWSMFTGLYAHNHNKFLPLENGTGLVTLPDVLGEHGYVTSGFISSRILGGFADEFDYFNGHEDKRRYNNPIEKRAEETTEDVLSWLDEHSKERFFMWIHYFDPHNPYDPPEEYDTYDYDLEPYYSDARYDQIGISRTATIREDVGKYDGEITYMDRSIGVVVDRLKELGLEGNTLIVLVADHGECFGEHNFSDFGYVDDGPCVFHGKTLYDEETHVPLIIRNPKSDIRGLRIDDLVESIDVFRTILDMAGIASPANDGESLLPLINNGERKNDYALSQTLPRKSGSMAMAVRTDEWKFVTMVPSKIELEKEIAEQEGKEVVFSDSVGGVRKFLFNVGEGEAYDHYGEESDIVSDLEQRLRDAFSGGFLIPEINRNVEDLLKSLGYIT
jgi:arylsulfatase A-like enzyme